jgi:hypothetical protein
MQPDAGMTLVVWAAFCEVALTGLLRLWNGFPLQSGFLLAQVGLASR